MYKLIFISISLLVLFNCNDVDKKNNNEFIQKINTLESFDDFYSKSDTIFFKTDSLIIGDISQLFLTENEDFIVTDSKYLRRVLIFNKKGEIKRIIGKNGNGPGEYSVPYFTFSDGNYIYIIDDLQQKLIKFNQKGNFVAEKKLKIPIRKCYFSNKNNILFVMSPMIKSYSLFKLDLKDYELKKIGELEKDYFGVSMRFLGGGLFQKNNELFAMGVLEPKLYQFNVTKGLIKKIDFNQDIILRPIPSNYKDKLIKSHSEIKNLIKQISRIRNIFPISDKIFLIEIEDLYPDHNLKVSYVFSTLKGEILNKIYVKNKLPILTIKNKKIIKLYRDSSFSKVGIVVYEY